MAVTDEQRSLAGPGVLIARLRRLTPLDDDDLAALAALFGEEHRLAARATVATQGWKAERLYLVVEGWACTYRLLADGRRQVIAVLLPGDLCNLGALHLRGSDHGIGTLMPATIVAASVAAVRALADERRGVAAALAWLAAVDHAMLAERNTSLGRRSAREHVAHLLCELLVRLAMVGGGEGTSYALPLTQEDISDVLGLTSVHVNRVMQSLRRDGLIDYAGKTLAILDWSALREAAGFRTDYLHLEGMDGSGEDLGAVEPKAGVRRLGAAVWR